MSKPTPNACEVRVLLAAQIGDGEMADRVEIVDIPSPVTVVAVDATVVAAR